MPFNENLVNLRKKICPNAKDFAKQTGMSYTTYLNYEKGAWPSEENLTKIATALHVSIDDLLGYESSPKGVDYWKRYFADSKIQIIADHNGVTIDNDNQKAFFPSEVLFLQFMKRVEQTAKEKAFETEKSYIETQVTTYVTAVQNIPANIPSSEANDFMESLKDLESHKP